MIAKQTDLELGEFAHTIVDSHIYCGTGERGKWYGENIEELRQRARSSESREEYHEIREWILDNAPEEPEDEEGKDHVPGLLKQLSREPRERPEMEVPDKLIEEMEYKDFEHKDYDPHPGIKFGIAE
jgi:thymidylate synthase